MSADLPDVVTEAVRVAAGAVQSARSVGGGDVSSAARVETSAGPVFVKWGRGDAGRTYASEAEGLAALAQAAGPDLMVPAPLRHVAPQGDAPGVLVLPWIERGSPSTPDWHRLGEALAHLHRADAPGDGYGWASDNWIGSKPQQNGWASPWPVFFGERRLQRQAEVVRQRGAWDAAWDGMLDRLVERLPDVLPDSPPRSLVHGDLWGGNAMSTTGGRFAIIDPAVYVGHREVDLAMTELFGGFAPAFYEGYREAWPLEPGYPERREVYNLFQLINHLTHGPSYRAPVERTLRRFGG